MKSTPKVALGSGSRNINDGQDTPTTSNTNEEENSFKDTVRNILYEKKTMKENHFSDVKNIVKEKFKAHKSNIKEVVSSNVNKTNQHKLVI